MRMWNLGLTSFTYVLFEEVDTASIYLFKANNKDNRRTSAVFIVNFE